MPKILDLAGQRFGRLTVLHRAGRTPHKKTLWLCRCDCGAEIVAVTGQLKSGHTQSCGCLQKEKAAASNTTHGASRSPEYRAWVGMRQRCTNPSFQDWHHYGGRGIQCHFTTFEQFLADIDRRPSPRHSVDRIDNDGHYEPGNVRWVTQKEQTRNQRSNLLITYNGRTQCLADWAAELNMRRQTLQYRLRLGWSVERALTTPVSGRLPSSPS